MKTLSRTLLVFVTVAAVLASEASPALAVPPSPTIQFPSGQKLTSYFVQLQWNAPSGMQVHLQVVPANLDGPGINTIRDRENDTFLIPAPPEWYGLLPGMSYQWRVRSTDSTSSNIDENDLSWGLWSNWGSFTTPLASSATIRAVAPADSSGAASLTPTVQWADSNPAIFYYEVQLSRDSGFNMDPATAIAPIYWNLVHGGVSSPKYSYTVPANAALNAGATYYWRVRPRVQGDGKPVDWSAVWQFRTPG